MTLRALLRSERRFLALAALPFVCLTLVACGSGPTGEGDALDDWGQDAQHETDLTSSESAPPAELEEAEPDESAELGRTTQALGTGCTLLRPLGWPGRGVTCVEKLNTPVPLAEGQVYRAYSGVAGPGFGVGEARVRCTGGRIVQEYAVCRPGGGVTP